MSAIFKHAARVAAAVLLLAGCSGGTPSADSTTPATPTQAPDPSPPEAPSAAGCYRLSLDQLTSPTNDSRPVACTAAHTAQTIAVGTIDLQQDGHLLAVDSESARQQVATACPKAFAEYVGGTAQQRDLTRLRVVWFSPTLAEADKGAAWYRCDVVAFGVGDELASLKQPISRGALDGGKGLAAYGLCGTDAPGSVGFTRVMCDVAHTWKAISVVDLDSSKDDSAAYPGAGAVSTSGDATCRETARAASSYAAKFQYGWEWPTSEQWSRGQHFGYCWVPS